MSDQPVKLFQYFREKLADIEKDGRIERAWFTTFSFDISFFEKYILAALLKRDPKELQTTMDFEGLSQSLVEWDGETERPEDDTMEVRVFYDFRTLRVSGRPKQTTVLIHPVNPADIHSDFEHGVFHPKIILLQRGSEFWLMASSANLTFNGWAKNKECFFFSKIEYYQIAREVATFFEGILPPKQGLNEHPIIKRLSSGKKFGSNASDWEFISSVGNKGFAWNLLKNHQNKDVTLWSPYFDKSLNYMLESLPEYFEEGLIKIVPAKNSQDKIRITEDDYELCKELDFVTFWKDDGLKDTDGGSVHAKVWLTSGAIAIGSWNFTSAALNLSNCKRNNIEAGVIQKISNHRYKKLEESLKLTPLKRASFVLEDELDEDKEETHDDYKIYVDLEADWNTLVLKCKYPTFSQLNKAIGENVEVQLPGFGGIKINELFIGISFKEHSKILLSDRHFAVRNEKGEICYQGYVREVNTSDRPAKRFSNLDDYLKAWVTKIPEEKEEWQEFAGVSLDNEGLSQEAKDILANEDQNPWLSSFLAFERILVRIKGIGKGRLLNNRNELIKLGRIMPGNLSELRFHIDKLLNLYTEDKESFIKSPVYLWFLVEKANAVFSFYNEYVVKHEEEIAFLINIDIRSLFPLDPSLTLDKLNNWMAFVKQKLKIANEEN